MFYDVYDLEVIVDIARHMLCWSSVGCKIREIYAQMTIHIFGTSLSYNYNFDFDDQTFISLSDPTRYSYIYHGIHSYSDNRLLHWSRPVSHHTGHAWAIGNIMTRNSWWPCQFRWRKSQADYWQPSSPRSMYSRPQPWHCHWCYHSDALFSIWRKDPTPPKSRNHDSEVLQDCWSYPQCWKHALESGHQYLHRALEIFESTQG